MTLVRPGRSAHVSIAVFARAPVAGETKTRLIPALGAAGAARLHRHLVRRTLETVLRAGLGPVTLWCVPDTSHPFFRALAARGVACRSQEGRDLGERMRHALNATLPAAVLLVGSDCPALEPRHLLESANVLRNGKDAVFLPAEDGGYALIGLAAPARAELFQDIAWGGGDVMARTRERLAAIGYTWGEPALLWDVDRPEDLARLDGWGPRWC